MAVTESIRAAIVEKIPGAAVEVSPGSGGHFTISVTSAAFAGKSMLESQRMVYGAIAHLMSGDGAPVHAIDKLTTRSA